MNMRKRTLFVIWTVVSAAALCLCVILTVCHARAEEAPVQIRAGSYDDSLYYAGTLPDGGILLNGVKSTEYDGGELKANLLCLNADRTLRWEYTYEGKGDCNAPYATVLKDGRIAQAYRRFRNDGDDIVVHFLTADGQPDGDELLISTGGESLWPHSATPSYLTLERQLTEDGVTSVESEIEIRDWDGNVINVFRTKSGDGGFYYFSEEDDGLLLYGQDTEEQPKILKKESAEGKTLWETVLPKQMKDADQALIYDVVRTDDGGYAAFVREYKVEPYTEETFLVKLDKDGQIKWTKKEYAENGKCWGSIVSYNGKIACHVWSLYVYDEINTPQVFRWFDLDGNDLGETKLTLKIEDYPTLQKILAGEEGKGKIPVIEGFNLIPMKDGLWALAYGGLQKEGNRDAVGDENGDETILVRIPEL